ncbi:hypothetical protein D3C83_22190 [compost metagenome]
MRLEIGSGVATNDAGRALSDLKKIQQRSGQAFRLVRDDAPMQAARLHGVEQFQHAGKDAGVAAKVAFIVS